jgi:hypothetical protein
MAIKVNGVTAIDDNLKGTFNRLNVGSFTTVSRPSNPTEGDMIFDSDEKEFLVWNGTEWTN